MDNNGRPIWFLPITNGQAAADFRVQKYHNHPVLTWAQQKGFGGLAQDESADYIFDSSYHLVATVHAGKGLNADAHEFRFYRHGTRRPFTRLTDAPAL
jgi:hypothetical protein